MCLKFFLIKKIKKNNFGSSLAFFLFLPATWLFQEMQFAVRAEFLNSGTNFGSDNLIVVRGSLVHV